MTPIFIILGQAGSGKDTIAGFIAKNFNGQCIAQADPMKRLARVVFQFTDEQLWGPSECRNAPDPREWEADRWGYCFTRFTAHAKQWIDDVLPGLDEGGKLLAYSHLKSWFNGCRHHFTNLPAPGAGDGDSDPMYTPPTPRYVLQMLGTEWGRNFSKDMWIDYAKRTAFKLLGGGYIYDRVGGLSGITQHVADTNEILRERAKGPGLVVITDGRFRNEVLGINAIGGKVIKIVAPTPVDLTAVDAAGVKGHVSEAEQTGIPDHFIDIVFVNDKANGLQVAEDLTKLVMQRSLTPPGIWKWF